MTGIVERQLVLAISRAFYGCWASHGQQTLNFQGYSCVPAGRVYAPFPDTIRALPSRTSAGGKTVCTLYRIYKRQWRKYTYLKCKQTYFVVFQLRLWSFAILTARAHQTRATLTFQLDNNGADIDTLCASHNNSAAYLIEVCEGYITGLVEHDRGLHRHAGRPWRCDRRVCAILVHVNGPCVMCFCFQSCDLDREHQASRGCCGWAALRQRFVVGGRRSWQWGETRWKSLGTKTKSTSTWASVTIHWISESESIFGINKRFRAKFSCERHAAPCLLSATAWNATLRPVPNM